jgi:AhpD family alkylhydroperoxidase
MPTATTNPRIDYKTFQDIVPEMATGMAAVSHALRKSGVEPDLIEMLKVRISQLNGCAFCVQYHLNDARKLNVTAAKLDLLAAWREAGIYSPREGRTRYTPRQSPHRRRNVRPRLSAFFRARNCIPDHGHWPNQFLESGSGAFAFHSADPRWFLALVLGLC